MQDFAYGPGRDRTYDLRIMSPTGDQALLADDPGGGR